LPSEGKRSRYAASRGTALSINRENRVSRAPATKPVRLSRFRGTAGPAGVAVRVFDRYHSPAAYRAVLIGKLPKSQQPKAKRALQEIWMAESKATAELAFDAFIESYTPKYEKAADCNQLPKLALRVTFNDGIEVIAKQADRQPKTAAA
jgi:hypothetical protein